MEKFKFDKDFQWSILKYTLRDKQGYKALLLYKPSYFILIDQQVIAKGLHRYFKRKKQIPRSSAVLNEELNNLFRTKDYAQSILEADRLRIKSKVRRLYKSMVSDGDEILHKCKTFASYIEFKSTLEDIDLTNFDQYEAYSKKIQKAINLGMEIEENKGRFLVAGHQQRFFERYNESEIIPTPFRQINNLTNAGGYTRGSLIVVVDRPKRGKTWTLTNVASAYMRKKGMYNKIGSPTKGQKAAKKIIYFDLENGEVAIETRFDQQLVNQNKQDVLDHKYDAELKKIYRQFRRMQGEIHTRRMPWGSTTDDFQRVLDEIYTEFGIRFEVAIVDYAALMGSVAKDREEFQRISNAYLDLKNWALHNKFDVVWTAHHVKREAYKRRSTRFQPDDLAKCIDIERHVDALYGIQQNEIEEEGNVFRLEIISQRDGYQYGRALFWANQASQRLTEFTREEEAKYNEQMESEEGHEHKETPKEKEERIKNQRNKDL